MDQILESIFAEIRKRMNGEKISSSKQFSKNYRVVPVVLADTAVTPVSLNTVRGKHFKKRFDCCGSVSRNQAVRKM